MLWQSLSPHLLFCKTSADRCIRRWRAAQPCSPNPRHRHRLGFTHMETFIGQDSYQLKSTATQKKQSTGYGDTTGASKIVSVIKQKFLASYSQFTSRQTEVQQEEEVTQQEWLRSHPVLQREVSWSSPATALWSTPNTPSSSPSCGAGSYGQ